MVHFEVPLSSYNGIQPFNSSGIIIMSQCDISKLPTVKDSVCLGDICIFYHAKPAEANCVPWAAGKLHNLHFTSKNQSEISNTKTLMQQLNLL